MNSLNFGLFYLSALKYFVTSYLPPNYQIFIIAPRNFRSELVYPPCSVKTESNSIISFSLLSSLKFLAYDYVTPTKLN